MAISLSDYGDSDEAEQVDSVVLSSKSLTPAAEENSIAAMGKLKEDLAMSVKENEFQTTRANDLECDLAAAYFQIRALSGNFLMFWCLIIGDYCCYFTFRGKGRLSY